MAPLTEDEKLELRRRSRRKAFKILAISALASLAVLVGLIFVIAWTCSGMSFH